MWMCLLLICVCSYGVFRQALFFANKEPYWGVINDVFYKPYWHVYGELFIEQQGGFPEAAIKCVFRCCNDFSALFKTARSLLFRRETKVRAKCMCTSDTRRTRDGRVSSQPRSESQHPSEKGHVMRLVSSESRERCYF